MDWADGFGSTVKNYLILERKYINFIVLLLGLGGRLVFIICLFTD